MTTSNCEQLGVTGGQGAEPSAGWKSLTFPTIPEAKGPARGYGTGDWLADLGFPSKFRGLKTHGLSYVPRQAQARKEEVKQWSKRC